MKLLYQKRHRAAQKVVQFKSKSPSLIGNNWHCVMLSMLEVQFTCLKRIIDNGGSGIHFFEKFLGNETNYSNSYNAVSNFDL